MSGSIMPYELLVSWPLPAAHRAQRAALLLSLLLCKSLVSCCRPGEYLNEGICCPLCPPGSIVRDHCTATLSSTVCIPCVDKTYMDLSNGLLKCFRCKECDVGAGLVEKTKCTPNSNTKCECQNGYYCASGEECDLCTPHTKCRPGEYVKAEGNSSANTVCEPCPPGQFSTEFMAKICTPWKRCDYTIKEGNSTSNSECGRLQLFYVAIIPVIIAVAVIVSKQDLLRSPCTKKRNFSHAVKIPVQESEPGGPEIQPNQKEEPQLGTQYISPGSFIIPELEPTFSKDCERLTNSLNRTICE